MVDNFLEVEAIQTQGFRAWSQTQAKKRNVERIARTRFSFPLQGSPPWPDSSDPSETAKQTI